MRKSWAIPLSKGVYVCVGGWVGVGGCVCVVPYPMHGKKKYWSLTIVISMTHIEQGRHRDCIGDLIRTLKSRSHLSGTG